MKKIIILGGSILQVPAIIKAKEMGLYVIVLDMDTEAVGFKFADEYYIISTIDTQRVLELAKKIKPDGIITLASDKPMLTVAKVGEVLDLNTISIDTSVKVTNKARMREALDINKVPIPKFKIVNSKSEYMRNITEFGDKFIVKPADSSGSRGIFLVDDKSQIEHAYEHSIKYSSTGEVLIEEYLEGPEVSVESITVDGKTEIIAITDKETTGAPHFVELGHVIPSRFDEDIKTKIKDITKLAIKSLGISVGPSHTEIKITSEGPKIIEVGARLGGDNITTHLVPLATNIDIVKITIELALGKSPNINKKTNKSAAIRYFKVVSGEIIDIKGTDMAQQMKGIKEIRFTKKIGDYIETFKSSQDRVGFVISQAENSYEAIKLCNEAMNTINIDVL